MTNSIAKSDRDAESAEEFWARQHFQVGNLLEYLARHVWGNAPWQKKSNITHEYKQHLIIYLVETLWAIVWGQFGECFLFFFVFFPLFQSVPVHPAKSKWWIWSTNTRENKNLCLCGLSPLSFRISNDTWIDASKLSKGEYTTLVACIGGVRASKIENGGMAHMQLFPRATSFLRSMEESNSGNWNSRAGWLDEITQVPQFLTQHCYSEHHRTFIHSAGKGCLNWFQFQIWEPHCGMRDRARLIIPTTICAILPLITLKWTERQEKPDAPIIHKEKNIR